jgi:hypothetical protein
MLHRCDRPLSNIELLSKAGERCKIRYKESTVDFDTKPGVIYLFDSNPEFISSRKQN